MANPSSHAPNEAGARDRDAFESLFRAHHPALLRFARTQLGETAAAEDVVHDVFHRLWRNRTDLSVHGRPRSYLFAAVRNRVIDIRRERAAESRSVEFRPDPAAAHGANLVSPAVPADPAQLTELRAAIDRTIDGLPDRCRTAFQLCREHDMTYAEAADVMGVSPATVKTQIARALATLRGAVEPFLALIAAAAPTLR